MILDFVGFGRLIGLVASARALEMQPDRNTRVVPRATSDSPIQYASSPTEGMVAVGAPARRGTWGIKGGAGPARNLEAAEKPASSRA